MKICNSCGISKPLHSFTKRAASNDRLEKHCKECKAIKHKDYQASNKKKLNDYMKIYYKTNAIARRKKSEYKKEYTAREKRKTLDRDLQKTYKITLSEYEQLLAKQHNLCAICCKEETVRHNNSKNMKKLCIDRDYNTGEIRALICDNCNIFVGHIEKAIRENMLTNILMHINPAITNKKLKSILP